MIAYQATFVDVSQTHSRMPAMPVYTRLVELTNPDGGTPWKVSQHGVGIPVNPRLLTLGEILKPRKSTPADNDGNQV